MIELVVLYDRGKALLFSSYIMTSAHWYAMQDLDSHGHCFDASL